MNANSDARSTVRRSGCPFLGFHWAPGTDTLMESGGNECGLDIDGHGPCAKQEAGLTVNYNTCPMADRHRGLVTVFSRYVRFCPAGEQRSVGFNDWLRAVMSGHNECLALGRDSDTRKLG